MHVERLWTTPPKGWKKYLFKKQRLVRFSGEVPDRQSYKLDRGTHHYHGISGYSGVSGFSGYSGLSGYSCGFPRSNGKSQSGFSSPNLSAPTLLAKPAPDQTKRLSLWHLDFQKLDGTWKLQGTLSWDCYGLRTRFGKNSWSALSKENCDLDFKRLRDIKTWIFAESL